MFGVFVPLENFSLIWRCQHWRWGARHSWPLNSEGSFTCHIYCDTGIPFLMAIAEDPCYPNLLPSAWQWSCHYLSWRFMSVLTRDVFPISRFQGKRSTTAAVSLLKKMYVYLTDTDLRSTLFWGLLSGFSICCFTLIDNNNILVNFTC